MNTPYPLCWFNVFFRALCLAGLVVAGLTQGYAKEIYVSVEGHPQADGRLERPYGSLANAVEAGRTLRGSGFDDPLFNDPENGDFSFRSGSPALDLGIEPLDVSQMGRLKPSDSANERSFHISDGSRFVAPDFYPEFSWEVTPQYFMFGDTQRVLRPEEVRSIAARTDFIGIEKSHGLKELDAAELGAKQAAGGSIALPVAQCEYAVRWIRSPFSATTAAPASRIAVTVSMNAGVWSMTGYSQGSCDDPCPQIEGASNFESPK